MIKTRILLLIVLVLGMTSCLKKETPITLPAQGDAISQSLRMGSDYNTQYYYNLTKGKVVHTSKVNSWHLAFESSKHGEAVLLNGGVGMGVVKTNKTDFDAVEWTDCDGETWYQDNPNGVLEEVAFGDWNADAMSRDKIYIVRLDATSKNVVTIKLKEVTENYYRFQVGNLDKGYLGEFQITKQSTRVFTYFDLHELEEVINVEPVKESWDLLFTRYGFTFYDETPPLPYIVTGVLTNPLSKTFKDSLSSFYEIEESILEHCNLSTNRDVIGYDWKYYDFDLGIYHIRQHYNYIIKTQNEDYFKLRFLSFYDDNGLKGTPTFEFKQIK